MNLANPLICFGVVGIVLMTWRDGLYAQEDPEAVIEEKCAADWPDNSRMRAACIEQQGKVLNKSLTTPVDPRLPLEDLTMLREKCAKDWPDDFRSRARCEQNQIQGFQKLLTPPPKDVTLKDYSVVMNSCARDWPDDFRLRARCVEQQLAPRRLHHELNREQELNGRMESK